MRRPANIHIGQRCALLPRKKLAGPIGVASVIPGGGAIAVYLLPLSRAQGVEDDSSKF
jgi:hypothetical protein